MGSRFTVFVRISVKNRIKNKNKIKIKMKMKIKNSLKVLRFLSWKLLQYWVLMNTEEHFPGKKAERRRNDVKSFQFMRLLLSTVLYCTALYCTLHDMTDGALRWSLFFNKSSLPGQRPHRKYITVGCVCYTARSVKYTGDALLCPVTRWQLKITMDYQIY